MYLLYNPAGRTLSLVLVALRKHDGVLCACGGARGGFDRAVPGRTNAY